MVSWHIYITNKHCYSKLKFCNFCSSVSTLSSRPLVTPRHHEKTATLSVKQLKWIHTWRILSMIVYLSVVFTTPWVFSVRYSPQTTALSWRSQFRVLSVRLSGPDTDRGRFPHSPGKTETGYQTSLSAHGWGIDRKMSSRDQIDKKMWSRGSLN